MAATLLITGALHEDGLADTADGFGASVSRERKLDIMRDSEIGTYGASALILSFMLRVGAIVSLAEPGLAASALIAAHAGARAVLPVFMRRVPNARQEGLSANAGEPPQDGALIAVLLGLLALLLCLGFGATLIAVVAARMRDRPDGLALRRADRRPNRRCVGRRRAGERDADPARRRFVALSCYFFTVEVMEPMTSEAILNSLSRLVMPWRLAIQAKSV